METNERREQEQKEKESKERVKALKSKDFDSYLKLIETTKDERIKQILLETD